MSAVQFTIRLNCRDFEVSATERDTIIWQNVNRNFGGIDLVLAALDFLRREHNLLVGRQSVDMLLIDLGSALPLPEERASSVVGRNLLSGLPERRQFSSIEIREVLKGTLANLTWHLRGTFNDSESEEVHKSYKPIPDALKPALADNPIIFTGEFADLRGLGEFLTQEIGLQIVVIR